MDAAAVRTFVELLHIVAGLLATALIVEAASWSYPPARATLGWVGWAIAVAIVLMALPALRRAWHADWGKRAE